MNNTAISGGAISIECNYLSKCTNSITNSVFTSNTALEKGGAIVYNSYQPVLANNTFKDNKANFGDNLSSYAVRIKKVGQNSNLEDIVHLDNIPSGVVIDTPIELAVVSAEQDQIMTKDSESIIKLVAIEPDTSIKGQNTVTLKDGKATFTGTRFYAKPGRTNVKFKLESSAIDYKVIQYLDPVKYADQIITVNFRWCKPGEIQIENICSTCSTGSFSVKWNETNCHSCPNNAACEAEKITLNSGYWRYDRNSTDIMECPNEDACLGGYNPDSAHPVNCASGYRGLLCNECIIDGDTKYERISDNQ